MNELKRLSLSMRHKIEIECGGDILTCLLLTNRSHQHRWPSNHQISTCNPSLFTSSELYLHLLILKSKSSKPEGLPMFSRLVLFCTSVKAQPNALSISSADCMSVLLAGGTGKGAWHRSCTIHTVNPQMAWKRCLLAISWLDKYLSLSLAFMTTGRSRLLCLKMWSV